MANDKVDFSRFTEDYIKRVDKVVKESALEFHNIIVSVFPEDTGHAKAGWQAPRKVDTLEYAVKNNVDYATVLWIGRHEVNGKMYGSNQMPNGGQMYKDIVLERMLNKLARIK